MKFDLLGYQRAAAIDCLAALRRSRADLANGYRSAFALSAITGSGKTVIATAVIEATFHGSADLGAEPDPRACFLWVTDDPALNNQTRSKMLTASDLLAPRRLVTIEASFDEPQLSSGHVYFLNVQKLSKNAALSRGDTDRKRFSMWEIIANTVADDRVDLYLVLDEAHRGMRAVRDRKSIVKRIVDGQPGLNPPVSVVWGISATVDRFSAAMRELADRTEYPAVNVDVELVRDSGLIKDAIGVVQPEEEEGAFSATLLRAAVEATLDYARRWADYAREEQELVVHPVLVIQVPDKVSAPALAELLDTVDSAWPSLGPDAVVNVFGEHESLSCAGRTIRWVPPESIQSDDDIRVVLAKTAISTGWDCPRAEVLYSERPASDATHIAQIVGRMVRQPLARRIATDDALNSVSCFLPRFNRKALEAIRQEIEGGEREEEKRGPTIGRDLRTFGRNAHVPAEVFEFVDTLVSVAAPDALASPLRRARRLAQLLNDDGGGRALLPDASERLTEALNRELDGLRAKHGTQVDERVATMERVAVAVELVGADPRTREAGPANRTIATHFADLERDTRRIVRSVKEGAGHDYFRHRMNAAGPDADPLTVRTEVAALLGIEGITDAIDESATTWIRDRLHEHAVDIRNTTGAARDAFRRVQEMNSVPEALTLELGDTVTAATRGSDGDLLPTFEKHLFADEKGRFPASLNAWEREVVETEIARSSTVAWYRNPSRATANALRIAYQREDGRWSSLQPDFIVVSRRDEGSLGASIVDPHGDHLSDALGKIRALARYAEEHGQHFVRIEAIAKTKEGLQYLDLAEADVRDFVRTFDGAGAGPLYVSEHAAPYVVGGTR